MHSGSTQLGQLSGFSSKSNKPTLKSALRSLYKKVHPDLFTDFPAEKAENERSFKLLQEYLSAARATGPSGPADRTAFRFCFYVRKEDAALAEIEDVTTDEDQNATADEPSPSSFQKCEVILPPPERAIPGTDYLPPSVNKALRKLLTSCGIPGDSFADDMDEGDVAAGVLQPLTSFLQAAAEVVRQHESSSIGSDVRIANIRGAMRLARGVIVGVAAKDITPTQQLHLLEV
eukprot:jgi/Chrzof1/4827/Cz15g00240.t1